MKLHENQKLFRQAVQLTANKMQLPPIYVEKDYWVTFILHLVFGSPIADDVVFKGGTALAKCFGLIERFSEDIDLVVVRRDGETDNQLKTKLKSISKLVGEVLPEIQVNTITHKRGMHRKTAHAYQKVYTGDFGQVRDYIVLESGWLGNPYPNITGKVRSFIFDAVGLEDPQNIIASYGLLPFEVKALEPAKTFCEKIMSLVRFSYSDRSIEDLALKIRHTYDLNQLLKNERIVKFFESDQFGTTMLQVAEEDMVSFKNNKEWIQNHPNDSLIFRESVSTWPRIRDAYSGKFKGQVFGDYPDPDEILATLIKIKERMAQITWSVSTERPNKDFKTP